MGDTQSPMMKKMILARKDIEELKGRVKALERQVKELMPVNEIESVLNPVPFTDKRLKDHYTVAR